MIILTLLVMSASAPGYAQAVSRAPARPSALEASAPPAPRGAPARTQAFPCPDPGNEDDCALRAQWASAAAAHDSARWAWWQMILSGLALAGLLYNLALTRRATASALAAGADARAALDVAERNAAVALEQMNFSRAGVEADLRAYVDVDRMSIVRDMSEDTAETVRMSLATSLKNVGRTPARDMALSLAIERQAATGARKVGGGDTSRRLGTLSPLHEGWVIEFIFDVPRVEWRDIWAGDSHLSVTANLVYSDVFRGRHGLECRFRSVPRRADLSRGESCQIP